MTTKNRRGRSGQTKPELGEPLEFDAAAADALAVVTLFTSGEPRDAEIAKRLLDELMSAPGGDCRMARGLSSVCAGLLALLEFYGRVPPERGLRELGRLIAQSTIAN